MSRDGDGRLNLSPLEMLGLMLVGHAIADYPLQGDFLAKAKNRLAPLPGVPWYQALGAHAIIHGGFVGIITGNLPLGIAEAVAHAIADDSKCSGKIGFNGDQLIHIATKIVWCAIYFLVIHRRHRAGVRFGWKADLGLVLSAHSPLRHPRTFQHRKEASK